MLGVGTRATGTEHYKRASAVEPDRHGVARVSDSAGLVGQLTDGIAAQLEKAGDLRAVARDLPRHGHRPQPSRAIGVTIEAIAAP